MNILVLHNNYPAQFKFLLPDLISRNHKVVFVSLESHGNVINGVKHYTVSAKSDSNNKLWSSPYKGLGKKLHHSELFRSAFEKLRDSGFYPDITIFHSGWGIAYFLKSIFPKTKSFAYAEWWFNWESAEANFDPSSEFSPSQRIQDKVSQSYLNLTQASEILDADHVWSPTHWQRSQFPPSIQHRISVIHEGVDTSTFSPRNQPYDSNSPFNITYTSRALEPMRCYNNFYKIIAPILIKYQNANLTIVGKDKPVYRPVSTNNTTLYERSFEFFGKLNLHDRISYYPRLALQQYSKLLSHSHIHFYFSRPFVASWSLLEAMASGCCLISNSTPMTSEFLSSERNALMVDCTNEDQSAAEIINYMSDHKLINNMAEEARTSVSKFDYTVQLKKLRAFVGY